MFFYWKIRSQIIRLYAESRNEIVAKKAHERLLKKINKKLEKNQAIIKTGVIVDASITVRTISPNGTPTHVVEDRKEEGKTQISQRKERVKKRLNKV
ncbi:MAG: hypothetical protein ACMUEL_06700 [Flavobacteriales bacterium Tduv]